MHCQERQHSLSNSTQSLEENNFSLSCILSKSWEQKLGSISALTLDLFVDRMLQNGANAPEIFLNVYSTNFSRKDKELSSALSVFI